MSLRRLSEPNRSAIWDSLLKHVFMYWPALQAYIFSLLIEFVIPYIYSPHLHIERILLVIWFHINSSFLSHHDVISLDRLLSNCPWYSLLKNMYSIHFEKQSKWSGTHFILNYSLWIELRNSTRMCKISQGVYHCHWLSKLIKMHNDGFQNYWAEQIGQP